MNIGIRKRLSVFTLCISGEVPLFFLVNTNAAQWHKEENDGNDDDTISCAAHGLILMITTAGAGA